MATQYNYTISFTSKWNSIILGTWLDYFNSTSLHTYSDCYSMQIAPGGTFPTPPIKISGFSGVSDKWTITVLDSNAQLWGTAQQVQKDIPNLSGTISIVLTNNGKDAPTATFTWPDKKTATLTMTRL